MHIGRVVFRYVVNDYVFVFYSLKFINVAYLAQNYSMQRNLFFYLLNTSRAIDSTRPNTLWKGLESKPLQSAFGVDRSFARLGVSMVKITFFALNNFKSSMQHIYLNDRIKSYRKKILGMFRLHLRWIFDEIDR
jgi:hypothetical protein